MNTVKEKWVEAWSKYGIGKIHAHEYRFHPVRKFRFDFAWPTEKVAVEIDGFGGGHQTNFNLSKDNEKMNLAQEFGWIVLRFTARQLGSKKKRQEAAKQVLRILKQKRLLCVTTLPNGKNVNSADSITPGTV